MGQISQRITFLYNKKTSLRFTYDNNYFNDKYQGIPIGGYTKIFEKLLENTDLKLNTDFFENESILKKYQIILFIQDL